GGAATAGARGASSALGVKPTQCVGRLADTLTRCASTVCYQEVDDIMSDEQPPGTRERILAAAAAILGEDGMAARLSVRAVAARAGVSTGSLRHHFPTQQRLRDEVMRRINDWIAPAERIRDASLPARDR